MGKEILVWKVSPACAMASWGPGLSNRKVTWVCADPQPSQSRDHSPSKFRPGMAQKWRQIQSAGTSIRTRLTFIVHRSSRFVFLISSSPPVIPIPDNPPHGEFLFFSSTVDAQSGVLICNDIQRQAFIASVKGRPVPSIARPAAACWIVLLHNPNSPGHCGRGYVGNATPAWLGLAERYGMPEELHSRRNSMQRRTHDPCEQTFPVPISLAPWETETNFIDSGSTIARRFQVTSKQEAIVPPIITEMASQISPQAGAPARVQPA